MPDFARRTGSYDFPPPSEEEDALDDLHKQYASLDERVRSIERKLEEGDRLAHSSIAKATAFYSSSYVGITERAFPHLQGRPKEKKSQLAHELGLAQFFSIGPYALLARASRANGSLKVLVALFVIIFGPWTECVTAYFVVLSVTLLMSLLVLFVVKEFEIKHFMRLVICQAVFLAVIVLGNQLDKMINITVDERDVMMFRALLLVCFAVINVSCCLNFAEKMGVPLPDFVKKATDKTRDLIFK